MEHDQFIADLAKEGFAETTVVEREANGFLGEHAHPFEAKALILDGVINIRVGDIEQAYRAGQIFHLRAGVPHSENYGPDGVRYLVGRK
jgi:quercetin dioxygenase-like cupin family protein